MITSRMLVRFLSATAVLVPAIGLATAEDIAPRLAPGLVEPLAEMPMVYASSRPSAGPRAFAVGDTLRVSFFEELDLGSDGSGGAALTTFYQRIDLTGDYEIDVGGTISIPTLGSFETDRHSVPGLEEAIARAFHEKAGRRGSVHVRIVARQPVYVVGAVRSPGAYAFAPGMVALQAIALGGGVERVPPGAQHLVDARREDERRVAAEERMKRLLARRARLEAEQDGAARPSVPLRLEQLAGNRDARALLEAEARMGDRNAAARAGELALQDAKLDTARSELTVLRDSLQRVEAQIAVRTARVAELEQVQARGFGNTEVLAAARREVSDHELSKSRLLGEIHRAERALAEAEIARERVALDARAQIERELMEVSDELAAVEQAARAAAEIAGAILGTSPVAAMNQGAMRIEIARRAPGGGTSAFVADEFTELEPGDVVNVLGTGGSGREPMQAVARGRAM